MDIQAVYVLVAEDMHAVNRLIGERLRSEVALISQMGQYIINSGGKRLRPNLVLLSARAFGYQGPHHINLSTIVEFIHTATLLHDDVVDASELRRGRETANSIWGNEASVLVGDFLYSRSFEMMVEIGSMDVMEILARATNTIAEGEVMQLLNCHDASTSEERYLDVIRSKTAKLFAAAAELGTVLGGQDSEARQAMRQYGMHLGTAFQLIDGMRHGTGELAALVLNAIEQGGRDTIHQVTAAIESTGAIAYTARSAQHEAEKALASLHVVPASAYRDAMYALAEFAVKRNH